jgi:predicted amidohydrolase YtcJ
MQVAVTRNLLDGSRESFIPEERIDLMTALAGYTTGSAFLNALDHVSGTLEVGKDADVVIFHEDLLTIDILQLHKCKVAATFIQGNIVFQDEKLLGK